MKLPELTLKDGYTPNRHIKHMQKTYGVTITVESTTYGFKALVTKDETSLFGGLTDKKLVPILNQIENLLKTKSEN